MTARGKRNQGAAPARRTASPRRVPTPPDRATGPNVVRRNPPRHSRDPYPLKLTQLQRETLLQHSRVQGPLRDKLRRVGNGRREVLVTRQELLALDRDTRSAIKAARGQTKTRLLAAQARLRKFFGTDGAVLAAPQADKSVAKKTLYQFKITLRHIQPAIWRRIRVRDCTLDTLHAHIQLAMGWTNSHLHMFKIRGKEYGDPALLNHPVEPFRGEDSTRTLLSDLLPQSNRSVVFEYLYDFGDSWQHEVVFEGHCTAVPKTRYPLCVEGKRACPPEDCGGAWGYRELLEALRVRTHPDHQQMREWVGEQFDRKHFDAGFASMAMRQGLPDWRRGRPAAERGEKRK